MNICVLTCRKNAIQLEVLDFLKKQGHVVRDFEYVEDELYHWEDGMNNASEESERNHAEEVHDAFVKDLACTLKHIDACIFILPCDDPSSLLAGWLAGLGVPMIVVAERVNRLRTIYRMANSAVLWIGDAESETDLYIALYAIKGMK